MVTSRLGHSNIQEVSSGEIMHSVSAPMEEAELVYIGQSGLRERLKEGPGGDLVVWDVGLGAAANAMAVVRAFESVGGERQKNLKLFSFESDLDPLRLALKHPDKFTYLRHPAPHKLLTEGRWQTEGLEWILVPGDFRAEQFRVEKPDLVFYDLFSQNSAPRNWSLDAFQSLYEVSAGKEMELYTYSSSTAVRATILASGFFVAKGVGSGNLAETSIAFNGPKKAGMNLLGADWLTRWKKSQAKFPLGLALEDQVRFETSMLSHPQFRDL